MCYETSYVAILCNFKTANKLFGWLPYECPPYILPIIGLGIGIIVGVVSSISLAIVALTAVLLAIRCYKCKFD